MRVEAYNQVAQLYNREKTQKVQNTKQMSTGRDEVQISSMVRRVPVEIGVGTSGSIVGAASCSAGSGLGEISTECAC